MNPQDNYDDKDDLTFMERHKVVLSIVALGVISVGVYTLQGKFSKPGSSKSQGPSVVSVRLPPMPTPPPAPTPPPPQDVVKQEEKMMMQDKVDDKEEKPDDKPPEAAPLTTNLVGTGPDPFGLKQGSGSGNYFNSSTGSHSKFGWYAAQVQMSIGDALRKNPHTRTASFGSQVRIWSDITGRVTRAKIAPSTGDPAVDEAISQSLTGLQLKEAPPAGMPMPIVMRISAQRPN